MRQITSVDQVLTTHPRGPIYIVPAPDPPLALGEQIVLDGVACRIVAMEANPTNPPRYVRNGHQGIAVNPIATESST